MNGRLFLLVTILSPLSLCNFSNTIVCKLLQASFFMTYVLTSGWASLSSELMQPVALIWNLITRFILRWDDASSSTLSFPYHTEVPKVLLFGLLGFTFSIMAPLILPLILAYFFLAFLVYRNQVRTSH